MTPNADPQFECGFLFPHPPLWTYKPFATSDEGDDDDNGKGGGNDNNHQSSMDRDSNRGTGMDNNMVQDRVASLTVNNIVPPPEDDGIGG